MTENTKTGIESDILHKYNTPEDTFVTPVNKNEYPFWVCGYGKTYPHPSYHEIRLNSDITCIEYIVSGSGIVISNNKSYIVNKGDTYMLFQGTDQNYYSNPNDPFEKIWINIKGVLASEIAKIYKIHDVVIFKNTCSAPFIYEIQNICKDKKNKVIDIQNKTSCVYLSLIQFLAQNYKKITTNSSISDSIRYYIDCHITENIKLEDVANKFEISYDYLIRLFKKTTGVTPHQYIIDSKMKIATTMLLCSNNNIEGIAENLGFIDSTHFSSLFEKKLGVRPTKYRKMKKEDIDNLMFFR